MIRSLERDTRQQPKPLKTMKTTIKLVAITSILTIGLATTTWASPRGKLSYEESRYGTPSNYGVSSSHFHVWFKQVGPRGKM